MKYHIYANNLPSGMYGHKGPGCGGGYVRYLPRDIDYDIIRFYLALMKADSASKNSELCCGNRAQKGYPPDMGARALVMPIMSRLFLEWVYQSEG